MFTVEQIKTNINHYVENIKLPSKVSGFNLNKILNSIADLAGGPGGGFTTLTKVYTEAEVQTMFSANGGFGHELLPAPGVGKYYQMKNLVAVYDLYNGGTIAADLSFYPNNNASRFIITLSTYFIIGGASKRLYEPSQLAGEMDNFTFNEPIWSFTDVEQIDAYGTLTVTVDYRVIDTTV